MDEGFYHWLAGFIDGEGCFGLYKRSDSDGWVFRFFLKLRDDDAEILEQLRKEIGGTVRYEPSQNPKWGGQAIWTISSRSECLRLVEILDAHPLRAKKRRDYEIWRRAVMLFSDVEQHIGNAAAKKANEPLWAQVRQCKEELTELRRYEPRD